MVREVFNFLGSRLVNGLDPRRALAKGDQEGLGQGGPRMKWAKGRSGSKNDEKVKVLRMEFSIVENLSGPQESIFSLSRRPQLHFRKKSKKCSNFIKLPPLPLLAPLGQWLYGVPWAAVIVANP